MTAPRAVDAAIEAFYTDALERTPPVLRAAFVASLRERMTLALQAAKDTT